MTAPATIGLEGAARLLGVSYDHFRKAWRELCDEAGFPEPVLGRAGRPYRWSVLALTDWLQDRSRRASKRSAAKPSGGLEAAWSQLDRLRTG